MGQTPRKISDRALDTKKASNRRPPTLILLALALTLCAVVAVVHWPMLSAQALSFDDISYLTENPLVHHPSWASAGTFLTEILEPSTVQGYYQPLTMISLMLDYTQAHRPDNLRPFHRTSLVLHIANTLLIVAILYSLFGNLPIAAAVGLLFAVHPMTVEPLAWIGERKTLLAAFFSLACLALYLRYARRHTIAVYLACGLMYLLAVLSKPTSIPVPFLMLLLDYWPLARLSRRAFLEKIPFFVVAIIFAVITYVSQGRTAAVTTPVEHGLPHIALTLCHNIIFYIYKIIYPANLSSYYAFPDPLALSDIMVLVGLIGTCILIPLLLVSLRWTRALLTGWLLFFIAILPTMGVVGFTIVIASDKYAYLPSLGLLIVLAWLFSNLLSSKKPRRGTILAKYTVITVLVLGLIAAESVATRRQLRHWRDTASLFRHMLTITPDSSRLHNMLALELAAQGKPAQAITHYRQSLQLNPYDVDAHGNIALALQAQGKLDEAIAHYRRALQINPEAVAHHNNLGNALQIKGLLDQAIAHYRQAMQLNPDFAQAHYNLANTYQSQGKLDLAIKYYHQALRVDPDYIEAHNNLGSLLRGQGHSDQAIAHFGRVLQLDPTSVEAHLNLALTFQAQGALDTAIAHYRQALQLDPHRDGAYRGLGMALQAQDKLDQAVIYYRQSLALNPNNIHTHYRLALALQSQHQDTKAIDHFRHAIRLAPDWPEPINGLAWLLATHHDPALRDPQDAITLARHAAEVTSHKDSSVLDTLAAAYAAAGQFEQAVTTAAQALELETATSDAQLALELATATSNAQLAHEIADRLALYQQGKPYLQSPR